MKETVKKATGSFYTCDAVAKFLSRWAITDGKMSVLEPSFGDGAFLDAALSRFHEMGNPNPSLIGVELRKEAVERASERFPHVSLVQSDFMAFQPDLPIQAIIGNPPYVRFQNMNQMERHTALECVKSYGVNLETSGSLWGAFLIHASEMLNRGGKLGFVLPYEVAYVRYAASLWHYLAQSYGKITLCRVFYDFFPSVDVETVLLLAERKGESTDCVQYGVYRGVANLLASRPAHVSNIPIQEIMERKKPFERELLPKKVARLLNRLRDEKLLSPLLDVCKFKIGYVSGNKAYFHPSEETVKRYCLAQENIRHALLNARQVNLPHTGLGTQELTEHSNLFYPIMPGEGEQNYIKYGEQMGVHEAYKCRVRQPWYKVPGVEIPDVVLTVFGDMPKLLRNDGRFCVSNSLLGGFLKGVSGEELICRWYNSLTLLMIELTIHSLGGGTFVFIPGETDRLELLSGLPRQDIARIYKRLAECAQEKSVRDAYALGDRIVLRDICGLSAEEIHGVHEALDELRQWRMPEKRRA